MRKRQDSVFERDYVSTLTLRTQRSLRSLVCHHTNLMKRAGYRLRVQFRFANSGQVLGTMVFALHRDASVKIHDESVESVLAIPIRMRASS